MIVFIYLLSLFFYGFLVFSQENTYTQVGLSAACVLVGLAVLFHGKCVEYSAKVSCDKESGFILFTSDFVSLLSVLVFSLVFTFSVDVVLSNLWVLVVGVFPLKVKRETRSGEWFWKNRMREWHQYPDSAIVDFNEISGLWERYNILKFLVIFMFLMVCSLSVFLFEK
ncbi:MAG: hypothetical protein VYB48_08795 [Pseudomonadota bacterium]|nr:hypothetical protein [Pseudomonadota bacterium]MEC8102735.1 hypothetical protein [Pseudomonadota bacterium]